MPADTQEAPVMPSAKELAAERKAAEKAKAEREKAAAPKPEVPDADRRVLDAATATLRDTGGEKWGAMRHVELLAMRKALERKAIGEGWKKHRPVLRKVAFGAARLTGEENADARAFLRDTFTVMSELAAKWKPKPWVCKTAGIRLAVLLTVDADGVTKEGKAKKPSGLRKLPPRPTTPTPPPAKPEAKKPEDKPKPARAKAKPKDEKPKVSTRRSRRAQADKPAEVAAEAKAEEAQPSATEAEAAPAPPEPAPEPTQEDVAEARQALADAESTPEGDVITDAVVVPEPEQQDTEPHAS